MSFFIDVIIPIPLEKLFTYSISDSQSEIIREGGLVSVPFGKNKMHTAVVVRKHKTPPSIYETKDIHSILVVEPIIQKYQLIYWQWIADYYMCTIGEVFKSAIPSAYLIRGETHIRLSGKKQNAENLDEKMTLIFNTLEKHTSLKIDDLEKILDQKSSINTIHEMLRLGYVNIYETVKEKYKPLKVFFVRLSEKYKSDNVLKSLLHDLGRAPKQHDLLMSYMILDKHQNRDVKRKTLLETSRVSPSVLRAAVSKGIFEEYTLNQDRVLLRRNVSFRNVKLTEKQEESLESIKTQFNSKDVILLKGVTSSGKTEVYKKLIEGYLGKGQQVLYLLPEIALTTQIITKLRSFFGEKLTVYHSKYNQNERLEVWQSVLKNKSKKLIVGTRSAVWLPFSDLGLIIIDEEHEASYKQVDPAPRFQTREAAIILAKSLHAKVLLGSATPSIESYYNTHISKFGLVELLERYNKHIPKPSIQIIDLKQAYKKKKMKGYFSEELLNAIRDTVLRGEQVILYQNRRGYASLIECKVCGHSPQCVQCDVNLTYHRNNKKLCCHYCGFNTPMTDRCGSCGSTALDNKGYGTEQIEAELNDLEPGITTQRLDFDSTRGKYSYEKIISSFEQQEVQVLIGTQMVSKGLDFSGVTLVGVMNADRMFHFQDFRAQERSFQTLQQLIGRVGRSDRAGVAIIQTYNPTYPIIRQIINDDYQGMFKDQLGHRREFRYPPYYRLIKIILKDRDYNKLRLGALWFSEGLKNSFGEMVLGPQEPSISKIKNKFLRIILIKISLGSEAKVKSHIYKINHSFSTIGRYRSIRVNIDVDCL